METKKVLRLFGSAALAVLGGIIISTAVGDTTMAVLAGVGIGVLTYSET